MHLPEHKSLIGPDKGIYLSKALTCMNIFLYKQELLFCQGDGYFWPHCCMNNLYLQLKRVWFSKSSFEYPQHMVWLRNH